LLKFEGLFLAAVFSGSSLFGIFAVEPAANPEPVVKTSGASVTDPGKEARLAWWREARFGMFIHWGVYSALAGEWKGQPVPGYAEHIMRLCKIPRQSYLDEVVRPFNPSAFDADTWVRTAKESGMQYIIITAMHHDGVAMYDSKVDDYNVTASSKFGRDPLRELKSACEKYGLKLGVYYSQAIDWSLAGDPRYPEPNGPERRKACVERKALPQILELLRNYHPALLWGDTPHLNPPELNEKILQAVRAENQDIIVNGRLAGALHGDYVTTPDRPAEFPPMNGPDERNWEAIPTTNESYGYHAHDKSHKPPSHFIRLLAKAAARGGNLLLNIGPRGDGTFAPEDTAILRAIAQWWSTNGESIRGTERTVLAPQEWGESTLKGNSLYLHVFQWPSDGKLLVGGLKGTARRVTLLSDRTKELTFVRRGEDVEIIVPTAAPDPADSVLLMECDDRPVGVGGILLQTDMTDVLSVFNAELLGKTDPKKGWSLGKGTSITSHVKGWSSKESSVVWHCRLKEKADFQVSLIYDAPEEGKGNLVETIGGAIPSGNSETFGGTFTVLIGGHARKGEVHGRGMGVSVNLGSVTLPPGPLDIRVNADTITGKELMRLKSVTLTPLPVNNSNQLLFRLNQQWLRCAETVGSESGLSRDICYRIEEEIR